MERIEPRRWDNMPVVVKNLIIINALVFLAIFAFDRAFNIDLYSLLGLHYPGSAAWEPWQLLTFQFMHSNTDLWHIGLNMLSLWMFGAVLENIWGAKRFLAFYMTCGVGAAIAFLGVAYLRYHGLGEAIDAFAAAPSVENLKLLAQGNFYKIARMSDLQDVLLGEYDRVNKMTPGIDRGLYLKEVASQSQNLYKRLINNILVVGASGGVAGVVTAFALFFPKSKLYLYLIIPVQARFIIIGYAAYELFNAIWGGSSGIAHEAHLGGMLTGLIFVLVAFKRFPRPQSR
jgi:membrane associated rhomboid family serine protease